MPKEELMTFAKDNGAPYDLVVFVHENGRLPVVNFAAGGVATPADAALMMQLGMDGVFVGSGIFKSAENAASDKERRDAWSARAKAIVKAVTHYDNPDILAEVSRNLGEAMVGINLDHLMEDERMAVRGW